MDVLISELQKGRVEEDQQSRLLTDGSDGDQKMVACSEVGDWVSGVRYIFVFGPFSLWSPIRNYPAHYALGTVPVQYCMYVAQRKYISLDLVSGFYYWYSYYFNRAVTFSWKALSTELSYV
jgi:hypothetical protein